MATATAQALQAKGLGASLTVDDIQASLRFFEGLGFTVTERWEDKGTLQGVMMKSGNVEVGLMQDDWQKGRDRQKGIGMRFFLTTTQNVDQLAAHAKEHGLTLTAEPHDTEWKTRRSR
ncbi:MAG: VOC family protein [Vicinamibacterales bacterium]